MANPKPKKNPLPGTEFDPREASEWEYGLISGYGLDAGYLSKGAAKAILGDLKAGLAVDEVARKHHLESGPEDMWGFPWDWDHHMPLPKWQRVPVSQKQLDLLGWKCPGRKVKNRREASLLLDARLSPDEFLQKRLKDMERARFVVDVDAIGREVAFVAGVVPKYHWDALVEAGKECRLRVKGSDAPGVEVIPE